MTISYRTRDVKEISKLFLILIDQFFLGVPDSQWLQKREIRLEILIGIKEKIQEWKNEEHHKNVKSLF